VNPGQESELASFQTSDAESYCMKTAPIAQLAEAIRKTHAGEKYVDPAIATS
jgi:DNA-binding NarL/FixJ family response regulator